MIPVLGFIALILFSALLLKLPLSTKNGITYFNSIFLATSAVTGTGITPIVVARDLTFLGQFFAMLAIQVGGLGFMIFFSFVLFIRNKKIKLSDTLILSNEINFNNHSKVKERTFEIIKYTFVIEFFGAMLLSLFFIPEYGVLKGLWYGVFHSISGFCNCGLDILGDSSLIAYSQNVPFNVIMMILMFLGGIGYFVIEDVHHSIKDRKRHLQVYTKIVLTTSILLIIFPAIFLKLLCPQLTITQVLFLCVTSRSTGFSTFNTAILNRPSKLIVTLLMFIGGGAGSTACGIRLTNFAILVLLPFATIKNEEIVIGYRKIDFQTIRKSLTIVITYVFLVSIAFMIMLVNESPDAIDLLFELVSAFTTTGLTTFELSQLSVFGQAILIFYMYIGRLGPITFLTLFALKSKQNNSINYPNADLML